jgi:hypothetical protein
MNIMSSLKVNPAALAHETIGPDTQSEGPGSAVSVR